MNKLLVLYVLLAVTTAALSAQDDKKDERIKYMPLLGYELIALDDRSIYSPTVGFGIMSGNVMAMGKYSTYIFSDDPGDDSSDQYHAINFFIDAKKGRHEYLGIFRSASDLPVSGGLKTLKVGAIYGFNLIADKKMSLLLGGGLVVGDFGLDLPNGTPWPVVPVPMIRFNIDTHAFISSLEFMTSPSVTFIVGPHSRVRMTGEIRMDRYRDFRDLFFDIGVGYRFFDENSKLGDLAGISVGMANSEYSFDLADGDLFAFQYYKLYGKLDLTLLQFTGGYAFTGRDSGRGTFVSIQAMYQF